MDGVWPNFGLAAPEFGRIKAPKRHLQTWSLKSSSTAGHLQLGSFEESLDQIDLRVVFLAKFLEHLGHIKPVKEAQSFRTGC